MSTDDPPSHTDTHKHIYPRTYDLPQFFGIVENQIYRYSPSTCVLIGRRSETLQPIHYPYIQALELTTILVLSPEKPSRALKSFAEENAIKLVGNRCLALKADSRSTWVFKDGNPIMHGPLWQKD
jgi:hypothetical protein